MSSFDIVEITLNKCNVFAHTIILFGIQLNNSNRDESNITFTNIVCVLSKFIIFIPASLNVMVASVNISFIAVIIFLIGCI